MRKFPVISKIELKIETLVNPSESRDKVITAITNVIDKCSPEISYNSRVVARSNRADSLNIIYQQIRSRSAAGVLRRMLTYNRITNTTWFLLNKQAAAVGIVAVIEEENESPLGPLRITIVCDELDLLIDWLAPIYITDY
ncbi:MAG: hypothetical protein JO297_09100 [Nitrososphaeraceae archaeon]|nr:hypothetical protein [Nitrososphaeraceae archaeon]